MYFQIRNIFLNELKTIESQIHQNEPFTIKLQVFSDELDYRITDTKK